MSRIDLPEPERMSPEQRAVYDRLIASRGHIFGPFRAALVRPDIAERMQQMGLLYKEGAAISAAQRQLLVLVTARFWNARAEWWNHVGRSLAAGVPEDVIHAIRDRQRPAFADDSLAAVYDFVTELYEQRRVSAATHDRVVALVGQLGAVELSTAAGYFSMAAFMLNAHDIGIPAGTNVSDLETLTD